MWVVESEHAKNKRNAKRVDQNLTMVNVSTASVVQSVKCRARKRSTIANERPAISDQPATNCSGIGSLMAYDWAVSIEHLRRKDFFMDQLALALSANITTLLGAKRNALKQISDEKREIYRKMS